MIASIIKREEVHIKALAKVDSITIDPDYVPASTDASAVMNDLEIFMPLKDLIDFRQGARPHRQGDREGTGRA